VCGTPLFIVAMGVNGSKAHCHRGSFKTRSMPPNMKNYLTKTKTVNPYKKEVRMQTTSLKAYAEVQDEAEAQRIKMKKFVAEHEFHTSNELAELSDDFDRYQFARRLPELRKKGSIWNPHKRPCGVTGKEAMTWAMA
jgi:predicted HTH transcriptional regulator